MLWYFQAIFINWCIRKLLPFLLRILLNSSDHSDFIMTIKIKIIQSEDPSDAPVNIPNNFLCPLKNLVSTTSRPTDFVSYHIMHCHSRMILSHIPQVFPGSVATIPFHFKMDLSISPVVDNNFCNIGSTNTFRFIWSR